MKRPQKIGKERFNLLKGLEGKQTDLSRLEQIQTE